MNASHLTRVTTIGLAAVILSGCGATTRQMRTTQTSDFLNDYSQLKKGGDDEALLRYVNPDADFKSYTKILIRPIEIYAAPESKLSEVPKEDIQALLGYFDATLRERLKSDYKLVTKPGPGVMQLRIALTETKGTKLVGDTLSSIVPVGMAVSGIKQMATGTPLSVGSARVEMELTDATTGTRLMAAVDERAGKKYTGKFDKWRKWQDAQDAYDHWSEQLKTRLAELGAEK